MGSLTILYIIWSVFFVLLRLEIAMQPQGRENFSVFLFPRRSTDIYYKYVHSSPVLLDAILFPKREVNVILRGRMT